MPDLTEKQKQRHVHQFSADGVCTVCQLPLPGVGEVYVDVDTDAKRTNRKFVGQRELVVTEVAVNSPLDRNVVGKITGDLMQTQYATSFDVFYAIWRKKQ